MWLAWSIKSLSLMVIATNWFRKKSCSLQGRFGLFSEREFVIFFRLIRLLSTCMSMPSLPYPRFCPSMATCCFIKLQKRHCLDTVFEPSLFASLLSWSFVDYRVEFWRPWVRWMSSPALLPSLTCFVLSVRNIKHFPKVLGSGKLEYICFNSVMIFSPFSFCK